MIGIGILSFIFLYYYLNNNYQKINFLAMFSLLSFFLAIVIYKIPLRILVTNINIISLIYYLMYAIFILYWISTLNIIRNSELGEDISMFLKFLFPTNNLKLFALFFMAQFIIGYSFLVSIFFYLMLGNIMQIEKKYSVIIVFISSILANLVYSLDTIFSSNILSFSQIQTTQQVNDVIIATVYFLALLWVSVIYLLNYKGELRILDVLKNRFLFLVSLLLSFEVIFYILTVVINVRDSIRLTSLIMLVCIALVSKGFRYKNEQLREKHLPYMITFLLILALICLVNFCVISIYISTILLIIINRFLIKKNIIKKDSKKINTKFNISVIISAVIATLLSSLVSISYLNNLDFATSMSSYLINNINLSSNEIEVFLQIIGISFYIPFLDLTMLLPDITTVSYLIITVYFSSIFGVLNFINAYLILNYNNLEQEDTHNVILAIGTFMFLVALVILLSIFIMKGI